MLVEQQQSSGAAAAGGGGCGVEQQPSGVEQQQCNK